MKLLLYCTKAKPHLKRYWFNGDNGSGFNYETSYCQNEEKECEENLNGKIVAECDFEVEDIGLVEIPDYAGDECHTFVYDVSIYFETKTLNQDKLFKKSCLNWEEMEKYLYSTNGKGYAIHIKNLNVFDKPKELNGYSDYFLCDKDGTNRWEQIRKAPQNMCRVFDIANNKYILISIRPEWLCKILNGEKTIEVRKKVLKEMK